MQNHEEMVKTAAIAFPETFGLRACPGDSFRIDLAASYVSQGVVYLYVFVRRGETWLSFAKATALELELEIVPAPAVV